MTDPMHSIYIPELLNPMHSDYCREMEGDDMLDTSASLALGQARLSLVLGSALAFVYSI